MTQARRVAPEASEVMTSTSIPRRGQNFSLGNLMRHFMAPTAIVGLLAVTIHLTFVPTGGDNDVSVADPVVTDTNRINGRTSREFARVPVADTLPTALHSAAATPAATPAASPTPTPSLDITPAVTSSPEPVVVTPTPEITPLEATPAVDWSVEGKDAGSRWSTASVNVRTGPGTDFDVISAVVEGRGITITDVTHDGWQQVSLESGAGWIKVSFLSDTEPVAPTTAAPTTAASPEKASTSTGTDTSPAAEAPASSGECSKAGDATKNMTNNTVSVLNQVCAQFSSITSYGGYRAGSSGYHGSGQAIDAMISGDAGWDVARWVQENASSLGVVEVIYQQKIWTSQRSGDGWRDMSGRGSASADHYDHVHISVA